MQSSSVQSSSAQGSGNTQNPEQIYLDWIAGFKDSTPTPDVAFSAGWAACLVTTQVVHAAARDEAEKRTRAESDLSAANALLAQRNADVDRLQKVSDALALDKFVSDARHQKWFYALTQIHQWHLINPPDPSTEFPWLKTIIDNALTSIDP